jgi:hypothetical protein
MEGKKLIPQSKISFTNGTRVITLATDALINTLLSGDLSRLFYIYNDTQKVAYYAPDSSLGYATVTADNQITIDASLAVLATGDRLKILIWDADNTESQSLGYISIAEIDAVDNKFDSEINQSTQAPTTTWALIGSSISGEKRNKHDIYHYVTIGSVSALAFKYLGRSKASGALFNLPVTFDYAARVTTTLDTDGTQIHTLTGNTSQNFVAKIDTNNNVYEIEVWQKGTGTIGAASVIIEFKKSFV